MYKNQNSVKNEIFKPPNLKIICKLEGVRDHGNYICHNLI